MEREPVQSSNLATVGYDPQTEILEIEFQNGMIYQYFNVSPGVYDEFRTASSLGRYFNAMIRNKYPTSRA
jgi:hypothetical protein